MGKEKETQSQALGITDNELRDTLMAGMDEYGEDGVRLSNRFVNRARSLPANLARHGVLSPGLSCRHNGARRDDPDNQDETDAPERGQTGYGKDRRQAQRATQRAKSRSNSEERRRRSHILRRD